MAKHTKAFDEWYAKEIERYEQTHVKDEEGKWIPIIFEDTHVPENKIRENDLNG